MRLPLDEGRGYELRTWIVHLGYCILYLYVQTTATLLPSPSRSVVKCGAAQTVTYIQKCKQAANERSKFGRVQMPLVFLVPR